MKPALLNFAIILVLSAGAVTAQTKSSHHFDAALISSESTISPEIQAKVTETLAEIISDLEASAGSVIVMEAKSGNIVALVALDGVPAVDEPAEWRDYNLAVSNVHELGAVMRIFPVAQALDMGLLTPDSLMDTPPELLVGQSRIRDFRDFGPQSTLKEVFHRPSNVGMAQVGLAIGADDQKAFLERLGILEEQPLGDSLRSHRAPILPHEWSDLSVATISYGHGISVSPVQLAAAYSSLVNGGQLVTARLTMDEDVDDKDQIISAEVSETLREMLVEFVEIGGAQLAKVEGISVGGLTGAPDMARPDGGYYNDRVITTFAGAFPMDSPEYTIVTTLTDAVNRSGGVSRVTAGWTVTPAVAKIVKAVMLKSKSSSTAK